VVHKFANILGEAFVDIGKKLRISNSVRGATFDAIGSSTPEFCTVMLAVIFYNKFEDIGIATIAGSGIFNILVIPMLAIMFYKGSKATIKIDKKAVMRDMLFYTAALSTLLLFALKGEFNILSGIFLVLVYIVYLIKLCMETKRYRKRIGTEEKEQIHSTYTILFSKSLLSLILVGCAIDAIIHSSIIIASVFNIPQYVVSIIILAGCTSIPDLLISVNSAKRGDMAGSISNVVGSNIFDICICLGLPMLICRKTILIKFAGNGIVVAFLFISMIITSFLLLKKGGIKRKDSVIMAIAYVLFLLYVLKVTMGVS